MYKTSNLITELNYNTLDYNKLTGNDTLCTTCIFQSCTKVLLIIDSYICDYEIEYKMLRIKRVDIMFIIIIVQGK